MANTNLITHSLSGKIVMQRESDGYISATAMCKAAGKKLNDYKRLENTQEYLEELSAITGIPAIELIKQYGNNRKMGTWIHPKVAIHLAQWLSPKFAVQVTEWVHDWMINGTKPNDPPQKQLPTAKQETTTTFIPEIITTVITMQRGQPPQSQTYQDDVLVIPRVTFQEHVRRTSVDFIHNLNSLDEFRLLG